MKASLTQPRPFLVGDEETIQIGRKLGNEIARYVYGPSVSERRIPTPIPCSRCLHPKAESKEKPQ